MYYGYNTNINIEYEDMVEIDQDELHNIIEVAINKTIGDINFADALWNELMDKFQEKLDQIQ
jgi:hypothetical protein